MSSRAFLRVGSLLVFVALGTSVRSSSAAPLKKVKAVEPEPTPTPQVALEVTPGTGGAPWRLRVTNKESTPVRIIADPRLLILELTTPAPTEPPTTKKKATRPVTPLRCELPADTRPASDDARDLLVPPSRSWSTTFDPLFYCFGARERAALVPGTTVKAHYGWSPGRGKPAPPFVVRPIGDGSKLGPAKELASDEFSLKDAVIGEESAKKPTDDASAPTLSTPPAVDVARGADVATDITFTNPTDRSLTLLFRANMFEFTVVGPRGTTTTCGEPRSVATLIRELLTTVPAKGSTHTSVLVSSVCDPGTFDDAGIYRVIPRLDTRGASGRAMGVSTWDGVAVGKTPLLIRVRSPRSPELTRPSLD